MSQRTPRRVRRTTKPTIPRTHIAIATWPNENSLKPGPSHEAELVKAAVLYADSVELLSPTHQMVRSLGEFAEGPAQNLFHLMDSLDDHTLEALGLDNPAATRGVLGPLAKLDPQALRALSQVAPDGAVLAEFADKIAEFRSHIDGSMKDLRTTVEGMRQDSGVAEVDIAVRRGVVRINDRLPLDATSDDQFRALRAEIDRYLRDPQTLVVLDNQMASLTSALINDGLLKPASRAIANAGEAAVGTGLIARLPAFPAAPIDELLDLRADLSDPLVRYRRAASELRGRLLGGPFDADIEGEIDSIWRTQVAPELLTIREAMADHGLVQEMLRLVGTSPKQFAGGVFSSGLAVYFGAVGSVEQAVGAGLAALAVGGPPVVKRALERSERLTPVKQNDLFYLYELDRRTRH